MARLFPLLAVAAACSSGGPSAVPIDQIPKDKPLVDLSPGEQQGVCDWAQQLVKDKLAGSQLSCGGTTITFNTCSFPTSAQVRCTATVGQWEGCVPNFIDKVIQDPCQVLSLAYSQTAVEDFVNAIPGCEGQGACAYTTQ